MSGLLDLEQLLLRVQWEGHQEEADFELGLRGKTRHEGSRPFHLGGVYKGLERHSRVLSY